MSSSSKINRARRILFRTLLILLVVLFAAAAALWIFFPRERVRTALVEQLSTYLEHEVSIDGVSIGFYPDAEVVARGVHIADRSAPRDLISIQRVRLDPDLGQLLKRRFVVKSIVISSPELTLVRSSEKTWNLQKFLDAIAPDEKAQPKRSSEGAGGAAFKVGNIRVVDGTIGIHDEASGRDIRVEKIKGSLNPRDGTIRLASARTALPGADIEVSGSVSEFSKPGRGFAVRIKARAKKDGPLASIGPESVSAGAKLADITLDASGPATELTIDCRYSVNPQLTAGIPSEGTLVGLLRPKIGALDIDSLDACIGGSTISLAGECANLWSAARTARLYGNARIAVGEALRPASDKFISRVEPEGTAAADIEVVASMMQVELKGLADLTQAAFTIPRFMRKGSGAPSTLTVDARYLIPNEVVVDNFEFTLEEARIDGTATLSPEATSRMGAISRVEASISGESFPMRLLDRMPSIGFDEGLMDIAIEFKQTDGGSRKVEYTGRASARDVILRVERLGEPFQIEDLIVEFENDRLSLESQSFAFADSRCEIAAEVTGFGKPHIVGELRTDVLNLGRIVRALKPQGDSIQTEEEKSTGQEKRQAAFMLEMLIRADSVYAGNLKTGPVSTRLKASAESYRFESVEMDVFEGHIDGSLVLEPSPQGLLWTAEFDGSDLRSERISQVISEGERKIEGAMNASGNLSGVVAASETKDVLASLSGDLQLTLL